MRMNDITYEPTYKGLSILTNKSRGLGCSIHILEIIHKLFTYYMAKHNKVFYIRIDLTYPKYSTVSEDNNDISEFMSKYIKYFKRKGLDPHYIWVRERSREKHQHYHLLILFNANKVQSSFHLNEMAVVHWGQTINSDMLGLVHFCTKSRTDKKHQIRRNNSLHEKYDAAFKHASYLSKIKTKGSASYRAREIGCSRIPKMKKGHLKPV